MDTLVGPFRVWGGIAENIGQIGEFIAIAIRSFFQQVFFNWQAFESYEVTHGDQQVKSK